MTESDYEAQRKSESALDHMWMIAFGGKRQKNTERSSQYENVSVGVHHERTGNCRPWRGEAEYHWACMLQEAGQCLFDLCLWTLAADEEEFVANT